MSRCGGLEKRDRLRDEASVICLHPLDKFIDVNAFAGSFHHFWGNSSDIPQVGSCRGGQATEVVFQKLEIFVHNYSPHTRCVYRSETFDYLLFKST